jgi:hypothetical protein
MRIDPLTNASLGQYYEIRVCESDEQRRNMATFANGGTLPENWDVSTIGYRDSVAIAERASIVEAKQFCQRAQDLMDGVAIDESTAKLERRVDELELAVLERITS